jgi:hypothetical protein
MSESPPATQLLVGEGDAYLEKYISNIEAVSTKDFWTGTPFFMSDWRLTGHAVRSFWRRKDEGHTWWGFLVVEGL